MKIRHFSCYILLIVSGLFTSSVIAQTYEVIDLGTLGGVQTQAIGINDSGQVVGPALVPGGTFHAFLWENDTMTDLGTLGGTSSRAFGINNSGQVVGYSDLPDFLYHAFLWENGVMTDLGTLGGDAGQSYAYGINDAGQVVGDFYHPESNTHHAFLWENGVMTDLGTLGGTQSYAYGINDAGQVIGYSRLPGDTLEHAFLWENGVMTDLGGTFGGSQAWAQGINNAGQVVGYSTLPGNTVQHAFLWETGVMTDLGTLGGTHSIAYGITDAGQVVGYSRFSGVSSLSHAFLWESGLMIDLNDLINSSSGMTLRAAHGINNHGEIVGYGALSNGSIRAFLLRPDVFAITSPQTGELWIAGEQDTIRWTAPDSIDFVNIEFSVDFENGGGSFEDIVQNYPADSGYYAWDIPDSILSRKCAISVKDASNPSSFVDSEVFKIKGYVLTRIDANGDYEAFLPSVHGWSFINTGSLIWPQSWYNQFDYLFGIDPFTGLGYNVFFLLTTLPKSSDFPDWPLFVRTFGRDQCYFGTVNYRPSALWYWRTKKGDWGGSCFGFAISSTIAFDSPGLFRSMFPDATQFTNLIELMLNDAHRIAINEMMTAYQGAQHLAFWAQASQKSAKQTLQDIRQSLINEAPVHQTLDLFNWGSSQRHEVVPYRIGPSTLQNALRVYIYDNNQSFNNTLFVTIDTVANGGLGYYTYGGYGGFDRPRGAFLMDPATSYEIDPVIPSAEPGNPPSVTRRSVFAPPPAFIEFAITPGTKTTLPSATGSTIGFADSAFFINMGSAVPIIPATDAYAPPVGYYVPSGEYTIQLQEFVDSSAYLTVFMDSLILQYQRADVSAGQTDLLTFRDGVGVKAGDTTSRTVNVSAIFIAHDQEKVFDLSGLILGVLDSIHAAQRSVNDLILKGFGSSKQYDLSLRLSSGLGNVVFTHDNIVLDQNSSHIISPQWDSLPGALVKILVDNGNDGTIDDTLLVDNQVTGVDHEPRAGIPTEFKLHQNYPNPFNPVTTILYELPKASHVTLKVYNILGQEVATLVDGDETASRYEVEFRSDGLSSGVYFYRFEANPIVGTHGRVFVDTKKLLLLK